MSIKDSDSDREEVVRRIRVEAQAQTGVLDLRRLNLDGLPDELFALTWLRELWMGQDWENYRPELECRINHAAARLAQLGELRILSVAGSDLTDLYFLKNMFQLQTLNCNVTDVSDLSVVSSLTRLQTLYCSHTGVSDLSVLSGLTQLQRLDCGCTGVSDLSALSGLTQLQELDCSDTGVRDLSVLSSLTQLLKLDCSFTGVRDLGILSGLTQLQTLYCHSTGVSDLSVLSGFTQLQTLDCSDTSVSDFSVLSGLIQLQTLDCSRTGVRDLSGLSGLTQLQTLYCGRTGVSDLRALSGLFQLQKLSCFSTGVSDLRALSGLTQLRTLDCSNTEVSDLSALSGLTQLQKLDCSNTEVSDLSALSGLTQLQKLNCWDTEVSDLSALSGLTQLQTLECGRTDVSDLSGLSGLTQLRTLNCFSTGVSDLRALSGLAQLQTLSCWGTKVDDLSALSGLTQLQTLDCSYTGVRDLSSLSGLTQLQTLDCSYTGVSDLRALSSLTQLQTLMCSGTGVCDLRALSSLTQLQTLSCSSTKVSDLRILLQLPALERLYVAGVTIPGIPANGVLSASYGDNCLPRLRAHFADLAAGAVRDGRVKLLILGNGGAGKTQIAGSLCRADFTLNPDWDSTHGIQVEMADLGDGLKLSVWDFGGQDIYHGAHALFLNSPAVMLLVWATDTEARTGVQEGAEWFRDYPLPYWLALARQQGHAASPIILVQNKCDQPAAEVRPFPVDAADLAGLSYPPACLHISVKSRRGLAGLRERLGDAAHWMRDPAQVGVPLIGVGRDRLRQRLEAMQAENKLLPVEQRRRLLSMAAFRDLCAEAGDITEPAHVLTWLDAEGVLFHRPGLFDNQVVLDQGWALDAIYAIFDRKSQALSVIRRQDGRFDQDLLARLVWQGFAGDEQSLFLSMMQSCGICFRHRQRPGAGERCAEYIAPDLLPDRKAMAGRLEAFWDGEAATAEGRVDYPLLHGGLIRTLLCMIGDLAGPDAVYWQGGVCGYEKQFKSRFWIEQAVPKGGWAGHILLRTQRGDAEGLLARLRELVEQAQAKVGLRGEAGPTLPRQREGERMSEVIVQPGPEPVTGETWYVSYAWADNKTPDGPQREQDVDRLCDAAKAQGKVILRDKNVLQLGDSISAFMRRLGKGDRVFVVLSQKYLESPNCMLELNEIWLNCRRDGDFLDRVKLWALPDANIWRPKDRVNWAVHWKKEFEELNGPAREHGPSILGENEYRWLQQMQQFYLNVANILGLFADRVQARDWDEWLKHGLQP